MLTTGHMDGEGQTCGRGCAILVKRPVGWVHDGTNSVFSNLRLCLTVGGRRTAAAAELFSVHAADDGIC